MSDSASGDKNSATAPHFCVLAAYFLLLVVFSGFHFRRVLPRLRFFVRTLFFLVRLLLFSGLLKQLAVRGLNRLFGYQSSNENKNRVLFV